MKSSTIVLDAITVARQSGFAFDVWYANHYLSAVLATGRYLSVQRYGSPLRGIHLAVFEAGPGITAAELGSLPEVSHDSVIEVERYLGHHIGEQRAATATDAVFDADFLYLVFFGVPAEHEQEFNAWYHEEHLGILLRSPYWPMCRRFRIENPRPLSWTHVALHYLTDLKALESSERTEARSTEWRKRLARGPWFKGDYRVYYRYGKRQPGSVAGI